MVLCCMVFGAPFPCCEEKVATMFPGSPKQPWVIMPNDIIPITHPSGPMQPVAIVALGQPLDMLKREHQALLPVRFLLFMPPRAQGAPSFLLAVSRASILASMFGWPIPEVLVSGLLYGSSL